MNEQKIAPVLSDDEIRTIAQGFYADGTCDDELIRFAQAVLARVGAVRDKALEEAALAILAGDEKSSRDDDYMWDADDCAAEIRALKGTPAAAVAEPVPFLCTQRSGQMTYRRAATFLDRFKHEEKLLGPNEQWALEFAQNVLERLAVEQPAPQPSSNPGPLAAVEMPDLTALLPGTYYMDPPDGGSVTVLEQLRRMAKDAERYRWLTEDHNDAEVRAARNEILRRMPVMSYSAASMDIEYAIAASKEGASQ